MIGSGRFCKITMSVTTLVPAYSLNAPDGRRNAATNLPLRARAERTAPPVFASMVKADVTPTTKPPGRT